MAKANRARSATGGRSTTGRSTTGRSTTARSTAAGTRKERTPALSRETVVATALSLAQREGAGALTLRRLGVELAVDATAFYRHFRDKDEIVLACLDRVIEMSYDEIEDKIDGADWRTVFEEVAWSSWRMSEEHAAIYSMAFARVTGGPGERRMLEMLLGRLAETNMTPERTVLLYRMFIDSVLALCGTRAAILCLPKEMAEKDATAWSRVYAVLPQEDYPAARRHAAAMSELSEEEMFGLLVQVLIDRIAVEAELTAGEQLGSKPA